VNAVKQIVEFFVRPMTARASGETAIMKPSDIKIIFCDIEVILAANLKLLTDLDKRMAKWHPAQMIGDVFLEMVRVVYF
jgi:hypothetical protein